MTQPTLPFDRIKSLYDQFRASDPWAPWAATYTAIVDRFATLSSAEFATPDAQDALWRARGIAGLGPGEAVTCPGAYTDPEIVGALDALRRRDWPEERAARAAAMQAEYARVLGLVAPHAAKRPQAKLTRVFAALVPAHMHVGISADAQAHLAGLLVGRTAPMVEAACLARATLRDALGPEADRAEHVRRSMFCWWLHENAAAVTADRAPSLDVSPPKPDPEALPLIELWPPNKQLKGLTALGGYVEGLQSVVQAVQGGATADDAVETLAADRGEKSPTLSRRLFQRARAFGLIEHEDGLWRPSADGERLLVEDLPEALVERLVVRVFGVAHLLRDLADQPRSRADLVQRLQQVYPRWTTPMGPSMLISWMEACWLVERDGSMRRLTEYGRRWASRLPADLPVPTAVAGVEGVTEEEDEVEEVVAPSAWPSLAQMRASFQADDQARGFVLSAAQITSLHLAWHSSPTKRFVLLSGLSGTGKTAIVLHYARLYLQAMGLDPKRHLELVAVSPDWRDPSGLLGYFNALHVDPTFQPEPALRLLIAAARDPGRPYFLVLDEMNLARVEQYFAPFLSAMETGREVALHAHEDEINGVPRTLRWPTNLFVAGTVNMDETTHPFSDKVLDRAFTLEFWDVDLPDFFARRAGPRAPVAEAVLLEMHGELRKVRRHFGYRAAGEVLDFVGEALRAGVSPKDVDGPVLADAIFAKVLPRLRGEDSPRLREALAALKGVCERAGLDRCVDKLDEMSERLAISGVTRFWA